MKVLIKYAVSGLMASSLFAQSKSNTAGNAVPFEIVSVRPGTEGNWRLEFTEDGVQALNVTLLQMLQEAKSDYIQDDFAGGPDWIKDRKFTVLAKVASEDVGRFRNESLLLQRRALYDLLVQQFHLSLHTEQKERTGYVLRAGNQAKAKLVAAVVNAKEEESLPHVASANPGYYDCRNFTMNDLAGLLTNVVQSTVVNQTEISGKYNFIFHWDFGLGAEFPLSPFLQKLVDQNNDSGVSLPKALQKELGLELTQEKAERTRYIIDSAAVPEFP